jgi:ATP-dependent Clp protease protease subunit
MQMESTPPAAPAQETRNSFLEEKAFASRTVLVFGPINDQTAADTVRRLIALDAASSAPIDLLVSSPGGHLESGDTLHDIVKFIAAPVRMIGTGWVGSAATHLFLAVPKERRFCLPQTRFLIHQRRWPGHRHRDHGARDHQGTRTHRPCHLARDGPATRKSPAGHRA